MAVKNKTAALLYDLMLRTTAKNVAVSALKIVDSVQAEKVEDQILGLGAVLVCMLNRYGLSHTDVLGIADNIVFSGDSGNMRPDFKAISNFMKSEWEIN